VPEIDEGRIRESFGRQRHMATLGVTIAHIGPGEVHLAMPYDERFCQQNGFLHAGAIASVAANDKAMTKERRTDIGARGAGEAA